MLRSNSKSRGNHVVSPEEEKERLQQGEFAEKEGFKSGMKERVGDGNEVINPAIFGYVATRKPDYTVAQTHEIIQCLSSSR